jgi:Replication-relaxation
MTATNPPEQSRPAAVDNRAEPADAPSADPSAPVSRRRGVSAAQPRRTRGQRKSDNPHVPKRPVHRKNSTGPRRTELLQALGIFQRATPEQLWKLTRPTNKHDKLVRETLLDLQDHRLVWIESKGGDQRQVWVLTARGHREARTHLLPRGIRLSALRKEEYHPVTGELLGAGYADHALAVTATAAELTRAGFGSLLAWQTEVGHKLGNGFVQRADLVLKAPVAGVPVMLFEVDRLNEGAAELVHKLQRYTAWFELLVPGVDAQQEQWARNRGEVRQELRLWRRFYPPTGREGYPPIAFVFADASPTTIGNTITVLEEASRRYWAGTPYRKSSPWEGITAVNYNAVIPVVVTTLDALRTRGADGPVWRRFGRDQWQTLLEALNNPDGDALYEREVAKARATDEQRRAAEREAHRPVCSRCGQKFTDDRWERVASRSFTRREPVGDASVCGACHADDLARQKAEAETERAARQAAREAAELAACQAEEERQRRSRGVLGALGLRR